MTDDALNEAKKLYKETVQLPKTDFPMKAGLQEREPALQKEWAEQDLYGRIRAARKGAKPWVLHDGPPYANGDAHTGTGMNKILKDIVVKFRTMQGYDSPYVPGWDCHGLPIEHNVLKEMGGKLPEGTTALQLREKCLEYASKWIDIQRKQFQSTGTLGRWDEPYLTTNPSYESNVIKVFGDLFSKGYITRAQRSVHWSWAAQSALAEAELEYEDREDTSIYLALTIGLISAAGPVGSLSTEPLNEELFTPGQRDVWQALQDNREPNSRAYLVIWTTTPWTLPANLAVAVAPRAEYVIFDASKNGKRDRYVVGAALLGPVTTKCDLSDVSIITHCVGDDLLPLKYNHPMFAGNEDTSGPAEKFAQPVVAADYVTLEDGTGLVHTAPGHGKEDFETGKAHGWFNASKPVCPVSANGTYYVDDRLREELDLPADYQDDNGWLAFINGKHIMKANDAIVERLREQGLLLHSEKFMHSYPHCWRTHTPVIFRATEQWFVNVDHVAPGETKPLRERILDEIKLCKWYPAWGEKRISAMLENRPDWCISRQRYWGIPIPAFMDEGTGKVCMSEQTVKHVAELVAEHGSNVWYDDANWPVDKLLPDDARPDEFKGRKLTKMDDIFDVWFESGSSFQSVMRTDPELADKALVEGPRKTHSAMYLEGDDQHRGWFQVSLILSVATTGVSPFRDCLTCAFVVDEKGEKGSKSKGNMWAIDKGVHELGADLIRLYFASIDTSSPVPVTFDLIRGAGDSYRKLRNTWRTLVANLFDFDPLKDGVAPNKLRPLDRWALSRATGLVADATASFESYEFHHAMRALIHFCTVDLSSQYIDVCKDALYCEAAESPQRRAIQTVYWHIARVIATLMAPVTVHTAEEMWRFLPAAETDSVHLALWPKAEASLKREPELERRFKLMFRIKAESDRVLDRLRKEKVIGKGYDANVTLGVGAELMKDLAQFGTPEQLEAELPELLNVSKLSLDGESDHAALQEFEPATDVQGLWVKVEASAEQACVRCYRRTGSVGSVKEHPFLCTRCAGVVGEGNLP